MIAFLPGCNIPNLLLRNISYFGFGGKQGKAHYRGNQLAKSQLSAIFPANLLELIIADSDKGNNYQIMSGD